MLWKGKSRILKVSESMARIKGILTERLNAYNNAKKLILQKQQNSFSREGAEILERENEIKQLILNRRHGYRKMKNYYNRRPPLFT